MTHYWSARETRVWRVAVGVVSLVDVALFALRGSPWWAVGFALAGAVGVAGTTWLLRKARDGGER